MGTSPTTTNPTATIGNEVLHAIVFGVAVPAAETEILSAVPFLANPIADDLLDLVVKSLAQKIYVALAKVATFTIIDAQVSAEAASATAAQAELIAAFKSGDINAIAKAQADFQAALSALVHLDGSASP